MPDKILYEYAVIRYVPRVEREEFVNVGIIIYSKELDCITLRYHINQQKIENFSTASDLELLNKNLDAFMKVASGEKNCGLIAGLDTASRFRWLTAVRSSVIQTSRPHPGFSTGLDATLKKLMQEIVL